MSSPKAIKKPKISAEYQTFSSALRQVLQVSHSELQSRIEADKKRGGKSKKPFSRAAGASRLDNAD